MTRKVEYEQAWLTGHPQGRTTAEYAQVCGISERVAGVRLLNARRDGLIASVGWGAQHRWVLPEHAAALQAEHQARSLAMALAKRKRSTDKIRVKRQAKRKPATSHRQSAFEAAAFTPIEETHFPRVSSVFEFAARMAA